jgi:hypothetical protein
VEIDALFVARRDGSDCVFVVEAKMDRTRSLAKHKLLYPMLGIAEQVPAEFSVVPVYVRISRTDGGLVYAVAECAPLERRGGTPYLTALGAHRVSRYRLWLPSSRQVREPGARFAAS